MTTTTTRYTTFSPLRTTKLQSQSPLPNRNPILHLPKLSQIPLPHTGEIILRLPKTIPLRPQKRIQLAPPITPKRTLRKTLM